MTRPALKIIAAVFAIAFSSVSGPGQASTRLALESDDESQRSVTQTSAAPRPSSQLPSAPVGPTTETAPPSFGEDEGVTTNESNGVTEETTTASNSDLTAQPDPADDRGELKPPWWLVSLAAFASVFGVVGTILGVAHMMESHAVRSALGSSFVKGSADRKGNDRLVDQVMLLLGHIRRMRDRITALEAEVQRLRGEQSSSPRYPTEASAVPPAPRKTDFFEGSRDNRYPESEPLDRREPQIVWPERGVPAAPMPPAQVFANYNSAIDELWSRAEVREVLDEYNRAASQGDRGAVAEFERRYQPVSISPVGDGTTLVRGGDDLLWFVPLRAAGDFGIVVPGPGPIKNWHKVYRTMLGQQAKERFGTLYEVTEGPELTIDSPAWAQGVDGSYSRRRSGQLRGALRN
jgi:hypothetical protein